MAELFQKSVPTINEHIRNVFLEGELAENPTIRKFRIVQKEANRAVERDIEHYNLDVIISVGYRVSSFRGTQFRIWATGKLREYIVKGFVMDDERLAEGRTEGQVGEGAHGRRRRTYFDEWEERIRKIRTSEANFYQKVRDVFATSVDYNPRLDYAKQFFATVQNKFHYAITGLTAAEIVSKRVDGAKKNMGLTNWKGWQADGRGSIITREQAEIAKNYLEELELKRLNLLVEQFLSFAELQSVERRVMYMKDWIRKLDGFLILNDKEILEHSGTVSHDDMEEKVRGELERYNRGKLNKK
jgi:hypothetical protein